MTFHITIDQFEGPLDLMLHLIKQHKLDLFDLDMQILSEQYMQYIMEMESLHLEIASEYLLELSHLLEYKSKKLLPKETVVIEEEYEEDHRELLIRRLIEYQQFKQAKEILAKQYEQRLLHMGKPVSEIVNVWMKNQKQDLLQGNAYDLMKSMQLVLRKVALQKPKETSMSIKELSVEKRNHQILERLRLVKGKLNFQQLCDDCGNIQEVIVTFLSILDLIHHQYIIYMLDENEMIWIKEREISYEEVNHDF